MNPLFAAARELLDSLDALGFTSCLIGGLVVARWGEPRLTRDVDATVLAEYGSEAGVLDALLARFSPRRPDARDFALAHRVLLLRASNGVDLDVSLAAFEFEREALERASAFEFEPGVRLRTCSAEDLIVYKAVAGRPRDIADIETVVARQVRRLDVDRVREWLRLFAELRRTPISHGPSRRRFDEPGAREPVRGGTGGGSGKGACAPRRRAAQRRWWRGSDRDRPSMPAGVIGRTVPASRPCLSAASVASGVTGLPSEGGFEGQPATARLLTRALGIARALTAAFTAADRSIAVDDVHVDGIAHRPHEDNLQLHVVVGLHEGAIRGDPRAGHIAQHRAVGRVDAYEPHIAMRTVSEGNPANAPFGDDPKLAGMTGSR